MAISLANLQKSAAPKPPRILLYGVQGIGKTTFCAAAPNPVFIQTEDGLGNLEVDHFPLAKSYDEVMGALNALATEDHNFKTLVLDSLDWLEPLIWKKVAEDHSKNSIEDIGYGKGYLFALDYWREFFDATNYIRDNKNMIILHTAHSDVKRFDNPETESYDRYQIKLHKNAAALCQEQVDMVLFANYMIATSKAGDGFNQKVKAKGSGEAFLYTSEMPAYAAKNRYSLPQRIRLDKEGVESWGTLAQNIPYLNRLTQSQQPEGEQNNG